MRKVDYLILGNGIAGHAAAKEIRKADAEGSILIISEESKHTYFRINLTDYIGKGYDLQKAYVNGLEWFDEQRIEVLLNTKITLIDAEKHLVQVEGGEEFEGKKILVALGAHPFVPPIPGAEKEGIFAMRTLEDVDAFRAYAEGKKNLVVLGGGLLGLEAAESGKELGMNVTVVESYDYVLGRQLDRELGLQLNKELEDMGIHVAAGKNTKEFTGGDIVDGVLLADGTRIDADMVLISAGVRPNLDVLNDSGLTCEKGLVVNEHLETNLEGIYGAGDIVEFQGMTLGLWTASMEMGKIAGKNMVGKEEATYEQPKLFTSLEIGDINIFSVGRVSDYDGMYRFDEGKDHHRIFLEGDRIVGGVLCGNTKKKNNIKRLVFEHCAVEEIEGTEIPFCRCEILE